MIFYIESITCLAGLFVRLRREPLMGGVLTALTDIGGVAGA